MSLCWSPTTTGTWSATRTRRSKATITWRFADQPPLFRTSSSTAIPRSRDWTTAVARHARVASHERRITSGVVDGRAERGGAASVRERRLSPNHGRDDPRARAAFARLTAQPMPLTNGCGRFDAVGELTHDYFGGRPLRRPVALLQEWLRARRRGYRYNDFTYSITSCLSTGVRRRLKGTWQCSTTRADLWWITRGRLIANEGGRAAMLLGALRQLHLLEQRTKSRMCAKRREEERALDAVRGARALRHRPLQPIQRLLVVAEPHVHVGKMIGRHVHRSRSLLELPQNLERLGGLSGERVRVAQLA